MRIKNLFYYYPKMMNVSDRLYHWKRVLCLNKIPLNSKGVHIVPFFIVGAGRSGNTLLRIHLNAMDGVVIPPETYVLGKLIRLHHANVNMEWDDYVNLMLGTIEYFPEFRTFGIDSLSELAGELKKSDEANRSLAYLIDSFYSFYARKQQRTLLHWGDKTPLNAMHVYRLQKLFPQARFIHMIRDGVDVASSYVNAGIYKDYRKAADRWANSVQFLGTFVKRNPLCSMEIRYESLVASPKEHLERITRFLKIHSATSLSVKPGAGELGDVDIHPHHANVRKPITTEHIGKGRRDLSRETLNDLAPILNGSLEKLGYERIR